MCRSIRETYFEKFYHITFKQQCLKKFRMRKGWALYSGISLVEKKNKTLLVAVDDNSTIVDCSVNVVALAVVFISPFVVTFVLFVI